MILIALALLGGPSVTMTAPPEPSSREARTLLDRAIAAAGGAKRLERYPAFEWRGRGVIHAGERTIEIEGWWRVQPPDHAVVETQEVGRGTGSRRRMTIAGDRGWSQVGGQTRPLPAELLAHERDQFYLYYLMRLVPLRSREFSLAPLETDALGHRGLRVSRRGSRDVDLYLDGADRLVRAVTRLNDPGTGREVLEELRLEGAIEAHGVRWPRAIEITWDGRPYFALELAEFEPVLRLDESLFAGPK